MRWFVRVGRHAVAGAFLALLFAAGMSGAAVGQACNQTGYTYDASCSGNSAAAGTTVSASTTAIAAAAATQGLVANRISSFRASGGAPSVGRAFNGQSKQIFAFGTNGSDVKAATTYASQKAAVERKKALQEANGRYEAEQPAEAFEVEAEQRETDRMRLGVSAGENPDNRFGLWANGAYFRLDGNKTGAAIESDIISTMVGIDYKFGPRLLFGISGGYESTETETIFNRGNVDGSGFVVAPYASIGLTDKISIDAVLGYGWLSYDMDRKDPLSNATITGSTDANRLFGSVDLVAGHRIDRWLLEGRVGASHLSEDQDAFVESNGQARGSNDITVSSGNVGARVGYGFSLVEPYVAGLYSYDFNQAEGTYNGRNTFGGAAGMNFWLTPAFTINLEGKATHKEDLDAYGGSATLRLNF